MILIAGLGNPGSKYQLTRHNFGFLLADAVINHHNLEESPTLGKKFNAEIFTGVIKNNANSNQKIILAKPQTFMNLSGSSIQKICNFYKIPPEKVIILHDDLDLELGRTKTKIGGGNAGHNGLKDIDAKIGKNYWRIRLGIGRPENSDYEISDYVLGKFNTKERQILEEINDEISRNFGDFLFYTGTSQTHL